MSEQPQGASSDLRPPTAGSDSSQAITVLLVGAVEHAEFQSAIEELRRRCSLLFAANVNAAIECLREATEPPVLIVLAQSRPGEIGIEQVERLRCEAPLARFVGLLGSWCEGETRSGSPWPGVLRVYWHQWMRILPELAALETGRCSAWSLPITASDEERLLWRAAENQPMRRGLAAIACADFAMAQWLVDACRACGLATVRVSPQRADDFQGAELVLWDVGPDESRATAELGMLKRAFPSSDILALVSFPRLEDRQRLLAAGVAAVLAKPLSAADLSWHIGAGAERGTRGAQLPDAGEN